MLSQSIKQFYVMVPKQTIGCFHESISCFGFDSKSTIENSFQPFLKTPKYKTIGCFDKTTGCFSLSLKNTFLLLKRIDNAYALDSIKSGLYIKSTSNPN